jgi:xanthine dehydrogenase accessory factor
LKHWLDNLLDTLRAGGRVIRVVVLKTRGSAPREQGAMMLVGDQTIHGTIGGGELEWRALATARRMLTSTGSALRVEQWPLGPELGQCCGGSVRLWFEAIDPDTEGFFAELARARGRGEARWLMSTPQAGVPFQHRLMDTERQNQHGPWVSTALSRSWSVARPQSDDGAVLIESLTDERVDLWIFGSGHVGRAVAKAFDPLPFLVTVVDGRADQLSALESNQSRRRLSEDPVSCVAEAPPGAAVLIMTYSHSLDYAICKAALARPDLAWVGLIGSETKATCFRVRMAREGISDTQIAALTSPIGIEGLQSKLPDIIAVSVAAQLLRKFHGGA